MQTVSIIAGHLLRALQSLACPWVLALSLTACTPTACNEEERVVEKEVEILIGEAGPASKEAHRRLLARGRSAIAILETGLYHADPAGRIRIVKVLGGLKDVDAVPVLRHIAARDDDELVREQASDVLAKLERDLLRVSDE